jgi:hypothetical protein
MIQKLVLGYYAVSILDKEFNRIECHASDLYLLRPAIQTAKVKVETKLAEPDDWKIKVGRFWSHGFLLGRFQRFFSAFSA